MGSKKCVKREISLRSGQDIFLVGSYEKDILGSKLPSMKQVLQLLFYKMRVEKLGLKKSMKYTISVTLQFWEKANIPTICRKNCIGILKKLFYKWKRLQKNDNRPHGKCKENEAEFIEKINNFIFDIAAPDAMEKMKIKEDKDFLTQQRKYGRPGSMSGVDSVLANKNKSREKRFEEAEKRIAKYNSQVENLSNVCEADDNEDADMALPIAADDDEIVNAVNNQSKKTFHRGTFNFIDDRMLASMDKCNLSTRHAMHLVSATAAALFQKLQDVTPEDLILNRTTLHAMRKEYRRRQAEKIIDEFNIPELFVLHWDGKLLAEIKGREKQERLAIVVTGDKIEKLLGVPKLENSSGEKIAEATYHFLQEWKHDNLIEIVCFDTTTSNTGINNGAEFLLERKLGRNLLFLPCRQHIFELFIKTVFEKKFGKTSAPEVLLFNRFSKHWTNIKLDCFQNGISDPDVKNVFTSVEIENLKMFSKQALELDYSTQQAIL